VHVMNLDISSYRNKIYPRLSHINLGTGTDCSIKELAETVAEVIGFSGKISWDYSKPDGTPRKLMDSSILKSTDWSPKFTLKDGLRHTYKWYLDNIQIIRK
jgi:GDP-L-fucose synthase